MLVLLILTICSLTISNQSQRGELYGFLAYTQPQISHVSELRLLNLSNFPIKDEFVLYSGHHMSIKFPDYSPDLNKIIIQVKISTPKTGNRYALNVMNLESMKMVELIENDEFIPHHPAWSPDGKQIALLITPFSSGYNEKWNYYSQNHIYIYDLELQELKKVTTTNFIPNKPSWSLDKKHLYASREDRVICQVNLKDGSIREITEGFLPSLSHDGKVLAFKTYKKEAAVVNINQIFYKIIFPEKIIYTEEAFLKKARIKIRELSTEREIIIENNPPSCSLPYDELIWAPGDDWLFYYGHKYGLNINKLVGYAYVRHISPELEIGNSIKIFGPSYDLFGADWIRGKPGI